DNWQLGQAALLESANLHCQRYVELVRRYMSRIGNQRGLRMPTVVPRVTLQFPVAGVIHLNVRLPAMEGESRCMEQNILNEVFSQNDFSPESRRKQAAATATSANASAD